jgi:ApaG protein
MSDANTQTGHSDALTNGIRVHVVSQYLSEHSNPSRKQYTFAYRITISNEGDLAATLRSRKWIITDGDGGVEVIEGPGVVGEQPRLEPGESHTYVSGSHLTTKWGTMEGHYTMEQDDGAKFDALVGRFFLAESVAPSQGPF